MKLYATVYYSPYIIVKKNIFDYASNTSFICS